MSKAHISKLALVALVALGSMGMAHAASSSAVAAKLKAVSTTGNSTSATLAPPVDDPNKADLKAWYHGLTATQQKALVSRFYDLPKEVRSYLRNIWADLPVSAG